MKAAMKNAPRPTSSGVHYLFYLLRGTILTPLEPQSRFGDKIVKFQVICPQNATAVLRGLNRTYDTHKTYQVYI